MIAASGILVVIAFVTLILGVFRTGLGLIWASIAASILAAIFLALGVVQGNRRRVVPAAGAPAAMPSWAETTTASQGPAVYQRGAVEAEDEEFEEAAAPEPEPAPALTVVSEPAEAEEPAASMTVVVIPDRDKFHKETCRYAKHAAAMMMSKASAKRQGYKPCGVCKP